MAATRNRWHVPQARIFARGLVNRCPNCGNHSFFPPRSLQVRDICVVCELPFLRSRAFNLGPWIITYTMSVLGAALPLALLGYYGRLPVDVALTLAIVAGGIALPLMLYRCSWSWWLMLCYLFAPHRLPANHGKENQCESPHINHNTEGWDLT